MTDHDEKIERVTASLATILDAMPGDDPLARAMAGATLFAATIAKYVDGHATVHVRAHGQYLVAMPERGTVDVHAEAGAETVRH